jgi:hypothetical protein
MGNVGHPALHLGRAVGGTGRLGRHKGIVGKAGGLAVWLQHQWGRGAWGPAGRSTSQSAVGNMQAMLSRLSNFQVPLVCLMLDSSISRANAEHVGEERPSGQSGFWTEILHSKLQGSKKEKAGHDTISADANRHAGLRSWFWNDLSTEQGSQSVKCITIHGCPPAHTPRLRPV